MKLSPKNWRDFQHYKDRSPPWIRLQRSLLDNYDFHCLPVASRALAPMLWLVASDEVDGVINKTVNELAFKLRMSVAELVDALKPLIQKGFFFCEEDDSNLLADCLHVDDPETETLQRQRTEAEAEGTQRKSAAPKLKPAKRCPQDFEVTPELEAWAKANCPRVDLPRETMRFRNHEFKRAYSDWPGTWKNWILKANDYAPSARASPPSTSDTTREAARLLGFEDLEVIDAQG